MDKMKIAFITRAAFGVLGGAASYMLPTLASKYCEVLVLTIARPNSGENVVFENPGIKVINIYAKSRTELVSNAREQLNTFEPDIVHMFQNPRCYMILKGLHKSFPDAKWAIDFRTPLLAESALMKAKKLWSFFASQLYVDHVFTHSLGTIGSNLPILLRPCTELPPGVDLNLLRKPERANWNKPEKFLYVGVIHEYRKLDLLVKAFASFVRRVNKSATLDIVGGGPAFAKLKKYVNSLGMEKNICLKGVVAQQELYVSMSEYDVGIAYVPYKRYTKSPSLKSLEYAAAGLPVIASDTQAHKEFVNKHGFKFDLFKNDFRGICGALERISKNELQEDKIAANGKAIERFDWDYIVRNDLLHVYKELLHA